MSSEERRTCIIEAACRMFAEKGFRGTTTRELAAAVGVTEPVLYEHFKTKSDLYRAIIEAKAQDGVSFVETLRADHSQAPDDKAYFTALGNGIVEWYTRDPGFVRLLLFSSLEGHELKGLFHERGARCLGGIAEHIAHRIDEGALRSVDPVIAARAFFGMVAHYALTGLVFGYMPSEKSSKSVVEEMVGIFLAGLQKQD
jgi:AcrR family transcriptional regulator